MTDERIREIAARVREAATKVDTWSAYARMPTARHRLGSAVVGGRMFVISGGPTPGASASAANEIFTP